MMPHTRSPSSQPALLVCPIPLRAALNLPSSGLATTTDAVVATPAHAPHFDKHRRCIFVVTSPSQLRLLSDTLKPSQTVVVAVNVAEHHECALRYAALTHFDTSAVLLVHEGPNGPAANILHAVCAAWKRGADAVNVFGTACITGGGDGIIPPGWDTVGKIRAITDAAGMKFDDVVHGDWESPASLGEVGKEERSNGAEADTVKAESVQQRKRFINKVKDIAQRVDVDKTVASKTDATSGAQGAVQSDFFQKLLLSGTGR